MAFETKKFSIQILATEKAVYLFSDILPGDAAPGDAAVRGDSVIKLPAAYMGGIIEEKNRKSFIPKKHNEIWGNILSIPNICLIAWLKMAAIPLESMFCS